MEQSDACHGHGYAILVACVYHIVIAYRASGLCYIAHAALVGTLYVVAKGEEGIRAKCHIGVLGYPFLLLRACERLRLLCEELLSGALSQHIFILF